MSEVIQAIERVLFDQFGANVTQTNTELFDGKKGREYHHRTMQIAPATGISPSVVAEALTREHDMPLYVLPKGENDPFTTLRTFEKVYEGVYTTVSIQIYPAPVEEVAVSL